MTTPEYNLPEGITLERSDLEDGGYAYAVFDKDLGDLGRILLQGVGNGQTHISMEISGDLHDPMTQKRKAILEPIGQKIISLMSDKVSEALDDGETLVSIPSVSPGQIEKVQLKIDRCEKCGEPCSMLIFAPEAKGQDAFDNYSEKLQHKYTGEDVPTWIIGAVAEGHPQDTPACYVLKVWPEKEEIQPFTPDQLNPAIEEAGRTHCVDV